MRVRVRGIKAYTDRHGKKRVYHRRTGRPIDPALTGAALAAEVARLDKASCRDPDPNPGTLGGLLASYRASPRFTGLADRTKADYHKAMNYLRPLDGTPLVLLSPSFVARMRDRALKSRRAGFTNHLLAMLSSACRHGVEYDLLEANPCAGISKARMPRDRRRDNRPWSAQERRNVLDAAPGHLRLPLALARYLGLRRGDILALPRMAYRDGHISLRTSKTGRTMKLPVTGELAAILDAAPAGETVTMLCVNSRGQPWTEAGFSASIRKFFATCVKRGLAAPGLTMHGLRHSVAAELRQLGYSLDQIRDYLGQETAAMAAHYSSSADMSATLIDMANVIQRGPKRERVLSNPRGKSV